MQADKSFRILQISDIHFGAHFDKSLWDYIRALVKRERPDLIVCTGDIVDHGGLFMLAVARKQLDALSIETGVSHKLRFVPGNHDCGPFGNLKFRPFSTNFSAVFGPAPMPVPAFVPAYLAFERLPWFVRWLARPLITVALYALKWGTGLRRLLTGGKSLSYLPILRDDDPEEVVLVHLDSNYTMRLASGNVDVKELTRLKALVLNMRDEQGARAFAPRIALVHHHPLPIPDSKITEGLTSFEPFLVLRNAGILLRELNRCDVDLILHGHKHYSSFARLGYSLDHQVEGEIAALGAGSAGVTHSEQGRNSVNFVDIFKSGRLTYTSIFFGGGAGEPVTQLFRNTRYVHGLEMHKMRAHRRAVERQGQSIDKITHTVAIDAVGVALVTHDVFAMSFHRDLPGTETPVYIEVSMGRVPHTTLQLSEQSLRQGHAWVRHPRSPQRRIVCGVELGQALAAASPAANYGYQYLSFNTYAITEWETAKAYERDEREREFRGRAVGLEFTGVIIRLPVRKLVLRVQLPEYDVAPDPMVRVMRWGTYPNLPLDDARQFHEGGQSNWVYDSDISEHEGGRLARINENVWELCVNYPLVGHRYEVKWRVRDEPDAEEDRLTEMTRRGIAKAYRDVLLDLAHKPQQRAAAEGWVEAMRDEFFVPNFGSVLGGADGLEVALFVYDDAREELKMVLMCPKEVGVSGAVLPLVVPLGEGIVGAALKRTAVVCYVDPSLSGSRDDAAYLYDPLPDDQWTEPKWKFVIAFPLFGLSNPLEAFDEGALENWSPAATIGVLTLSSTAADSGLARLVTAVASAAKATKVPREADAATEGRQGKHLEEATAMSDVPEGSLARDSQADTPQAAEEELPPVTYDQIWAYLHVLLALLRDPSFVPGAAAPAARPAQSPADKAPGATLDPEATEV